MREEGRVTLMIAAANAIEARGASEARVRAIDQTAWATTATATTMRPCSHPAVVIPDPCTRSAKTTIAMADGKVKPAQAAMPPKKPARLIPMEMPSWLLAGPGIIWHRATRSAKLCSSSHFLRPTYSSWKYPRWAIGPPNEVTPRRAATARTSRGVPAPMTFLPPCSAVVVLMH